MSEISDNRPINVIVQHPSRPGLIAGLLGCAFGILGIFAFGVIFAPLGLLCAAVGFLSGVFGRSMVGIGTSLLAALVSIFAALKTPVLLVLIGAALMAATVHNLSTSHAVAPAPKPVAQTATSVAPQTTAPPLATAPESPPIASGSRSDSSPEIDASEINQAGDWANSQIAASDAYLAKVPATDQNYRAVTAEMETWAVRRAELPQDQGTQRGQLAAAIYQGEAAANAQHDRVTQLQSRLEQNAIPTAQRFQQLAQECQARGGADDQVSSACARLTTAIGPLNQKFTALDDALNNLENTYQQEHTRQQDIADHLDD